jgi:CYTH domain-containing protein
MGIEIERKFLVDPNIDPALLDYTEVIHEQQGYTVSGIRFARYHKIFKREVIYKINYKTGFGRVRNEYQGSISKDVFDGIWPLTFGKRIEKLRYIIPLVNNFELELDLYLHANKLPMMTAEVEFKNESDEERFEESFLPKYLIEEVTGEEEYLNIKLAC